MTTNNQKISSLPGVLVTDTRGNTTSLQVTTITTTSANLGPVSNITITGGNSGQILTTNGNGVLSWSTIPPAVSQPAGSNSQLQFNDSGTLAGAGGVIYNKTTDKLTAQDVQINGTLTTTGNVVTTLPQLKIPGGTSGQFLSTDGGGNLSWSSTSYQGTVTGVVGTGSGLGFTLSGNITSQGNVTLTTPDASGLRSTLGIGTVANLSTNSNSSQYLNGVGQWTLPPGENNPNLYVNGNVTSYTGGNLKFANSTGNNAITVQNTGSNLSFSVDSTQPLTILETVQVNDLKIQDSSQAVGIHFLASNTAIADQKYDLPDALPLAGGSVLTATLPVNGKSLLYWSTTGQTGPTGSTSQPRIEFTAPSTANNQVFSNSYITGFEANTYAQVFVNGVLQSADSYTIAGTDLTMLNKITSGSTITVGPIPGGAGGDFGRDSLVIYGNAQVSINPTSVGEVIPYGDYNYNNGNISFVQSTNTLNLVGGKTYRITGHARMTTVGGSAGNMYLAYSNTVPVISNATGNTQYQHVGGTTTELSFDTFFVPLTTTGVTVMIAENGDAAVTGTRLIVQQI
jgi:hypothetical protein